MASSFIASGQKGSEGETGAWERLLAAERRQWILFVPVLVGAGILLWFGLPSVDDRRAALAASLAVALAGFALGGLERRLVLATGLLIAIGLLAAEAHSSLVSGPRLHHRLMPQIITGVVERIEPRDGGARLVVRLRRDPQPGDGPHVVRLSLPAGEAVGLRPGVRIAARASLGPVPGPVLPGAHDGARSAWFDGVAASGRVIGPVRILSLAPASERWLDQQRHRLEAFIARHLPGDAGALAVALSVGEQGRLPPSLLEAMRTAGLVHLLTVSGFHIGVVVGGLFLLLRRLMALSTTVTLAISVRTAAAIGAGLGGTAYALLSGAEVPAVRAAIIAWVALLSVMLGRDPLSFRLLGFAALLILIARPEALLGPSFQLSFAAVAALIALANSRVGRWVAGVPGEEGLLLRIARLAAGLLLSSLVIELVLMPIALAHFGRAGLYGMVANMAAIPLTAFLVMPLLGLWLLLSPIGLGALVAWALVPALELLAGIGTTVAAWPGAALAVPAFPMWTLGLMAAGGLIVVLLAGPLRWCGLPLLLAGLALAVLHPRPTLFVSSDGRQVGLVADGHLHLLRGHREGFLVRAWRTTADSTADRRLADLPGARCDPTACKVPLDGGMMMLAFVRPPPEGNQLEQLCGKADIITAPVVLPASCAARWLTLDRAWLRAHGAVAIDSACRRIRTVADEAGDHPWSPAALPGWRPRLLGPPAWTGVITE